MKKIMFAKKLITAMIVFYLCYNTWYGWNNSPESEMEWFCDELFYKGIFIGIIIYIQPVFKYLEDSIERHEKTHQIIKQIRKNMNDAKEEFENNQNQN